MCLQTQFRQTPTDELPEPLRDIPKDTPVMMYCTGGIRCDIYSPILRKKGFTNLYTLHGGIASYLREKGADNWTGSMFTFDDRLALAPGEHHNKNDFALGIYLVDSEFNLNRLAAHQSPGLERSI